MKESIKERISNSRNEFTDLLEKNRESISLLENGVTSIAFASHKTENKTVSLPSLKINTKEFCPDYNDNEKVDPKLIVDAMCYAMMTGANYSAKLSKQFEKIATDLKLDEINMNQDFISAAMLFTDSHQVYFEKCLNNPMLSDSSLKREALKKTGANEIDTPTLNSLKKLSLVALANNMDEDGSSPFNKTSHIIDYLTTKQGRLKLLEVSSDNVKDLARIHDFINPNVENNLSMT